MVLGFLEGIIADNLSFGDSQRKLLITSNQFVLFLAAVNKPPPHNLEVGTQNRTVTARPSEYDFAKARKIRRGQRQGCNEGA